jgi:hypothetical protein
VDFLCVGIRAIFSIYDQVTKIPEILAIALQSWGKLILFTKDFTKSLKYA